MRLCFAAIAIIGLAAPAAAQTTLTQQWRIEVTQRDWFSTNTGSLNSLIRSAKLNPATDHLTIVSRDKSVYTTNSLVIVDPATGADISTTSLGAASGSDPANFDVLRHGVTDDGVIYVGNLTLNWSTTSFTLYRMANESAALTEAYKATSTILGTSGTGPRIGDTLEVTGSGTGTEIWCGNRTTAGPHLVKFTTADGVNFSVGATLTIPGTWPNSPTYRGLSVKGTGATAVIWVHDTLDTAYRINPTTGAILDTITNTVHSQIANTVPVGYFDVAERQYVAFSPGSFSATNAPQQSGYVVDVTNPASKSRVAATVSLRAGEELNGNAVGTVVFDPVRNNLIFNVTNNSISAHNFLPIIALSAQDWQLLE